MKKFFLLIFLTGNSLVSFSQKDSVSFLVHADTIHHLAYIEKSVGFLLDTAGKVHPGNLFQQPFIPLSEFRQRQNIPRRFLTAELYLLLNLRNNSNRSLSYYFFPGMHYEKISLYKKKDTGLILQPGKISNGFALLDIAPGEQLTYVLKLKFAKTDNIRVDAVLLTPSEVEWFKTELTNIRVRTKTLGYLLCGVLLMMIFFTLVNYFITGKREFLYNFIYSICMFFLIFFSIYLHRVPGSFNSFFLSYLDLMLLITGTIYYLAFTRCFLDTKKAYPALDKLFVVEIWILITLMALFTWVHFASDLVILEDILENTMKIIGLLSGVVYIIMSISRRDRLMNYLALGNGIQILFFCVSLFIILNKVKTTSFATSSLFYFELGVVASVFFILLGLTYKNRRELILKIKEQQIMKTEVEKQALENQLAIIKAQQEERSRISADMHDDLGAGMTSIRLYSEIAKNKLGDKKIEEIEKISASADELLDNMNAIIWSMSNENDSLWNTVAYIRSYAFEYMENNKIQTVFEIPERLPAIQVSGEIRRNIFLVVKEALHNIVKHSGATRVNIQLAKEAEGISLTIHDNGKGIDYDNIREYANGLQNMKRRMKAMNIEFSIHNNNGTSIRLYAKTRF